MRTGLAGAALVALATAAAAEEYPRFRLGAVVDARLARTGADRSWLEEGLGKTRYGGGGEGSRSLGRLSQASLLLSADLSPAFSLRAHANLDAEPAAGARSGRLELVEAFAQYAAELTPALRLQARAGMFFPPLSLEHDAPAWTPQYTITPSAANTWVGEEVRATGAELSLGAGQESFRLNATGGVFGWNDPSGALLGWRGWALHDRQTGRPDRLPLAPLPAIGPGKMFADQASWTGPLHEVDDRPGLYAAAEMRAWGRLRLRALRYDNRSDVMALRRGQYAWATTMDAYGLSLELPGGVLLVSQHLRGSSVMGRMPDGAAAVGVRPRTTYVLGTALRGRHRLSVRWDAFEVEEEDAVPGLDDNTEDGTAWTAAYLLRFAGRHRVALEVLSVESMRPARLSLGQPARRRETLVQASLRLAF